MLMSLPVDIGQEWEAKDSSSYEEATTYRGLEEEEYY